jgi:hypothetical protein
VKKILVGLVAILLIVAGGVWYFLSFRLDGMIEQQIEEIGSRSFGTRVTVGAVETDIRNGSLRISGITVANPPGFSNPNAFSLEDIEAAVDYASRDIKRVVIEKPEIVIEEMGGETNFSRMLEELESRDPTPAGPGADEPVILVRHFRMNESRAAFESESLDRYTDLEVDAVELSDIRGTPSEVAKIIAAEVLNEIVSEAATEMLKAQARKQFDDVEDKVSEKLRDMLGRDDDSGDG